MRMLVHVIRRLREQLTHVGDVSAGVGAKQDSGRRSGFHRQLSHRGGDAIIRPPARRVKWKARAATAGLVGYSALRKAARLTGPAWKYGDSLSIDNGEARCRQVRRR